MPEEEKKNSFNEFYNAALFIDYENICKILLKQHTNVIPLVFLKNFDNGVRIMEEG